MLGRCDLQRTETTANQLHAINLEPNLETMGTQASTPMV